MRIGILGTGALAEALAGSWTRAGHEVTVGGRSTGKARALAERAGARPGSPRDAATGQDAVLLAVLWNGVADILAEAGAADGVLDGVPLIDPTNAMEHGVGDLLTPSAETIAVRNAKLAPGAHVVKAFNLQPTAIWDNGGAGVLVPLCGDDADALRVTGTLVRDAGGVPATLGGLARAHQLEQLAGFVIGMAFAGADPRAAIPEIPEELRQPGAA